MLLPLLPLPSKFKVTACRLLASRFMPDFGLYLVCYAHNVVRLGLCTVREGEPECASLHNLVHSKEQLCTTPF